MTIIEKCKDSVSYEIIEYQQLFTYAGTSMYKQAAPGFIAGGSSHGQLASGIIFRVHFTGKFARADVSLRQSQRDFNTLWSEARHNKLDRALYTRAMTLEGAAEAIMPPMNF